MTEFRLVWFTYTTISYSLFRKLIHNYNNLQINKWKVVALNAFKSIRQRI